MIQVTEYRQLGRGKLSVCLDNGTELVLYQSEADRVGLKPDGCVSGEAYERLLHEIVGKRAIRRAMHLLMQTDRTEHQLCEKLAQGGYPQACIEQALAYVKSFHYLDDLRYARCYIRNRQEQASRQSLRQKLAHRGVDPDTIELALEEEYEADETEGIRRLLEKRRFAPDACDEREFRRTYQYLMRRGFRGSDILKEMKRENGARY